MNRAAYLAAPEVRKFVAWASEFVGTWPKKHRIKSSKNSTGRDFDVAGLEEACRTYEWRSSWQCPVTRTPRKSSDMATTVASLGRLAVGLSESLDTPAHESWCKQVLKWGGTTGSAAVYAAKNISDYHGRLHRAGGALVPETADTDQLHDCIRKMGSGIAKVHALLSVSAAAPADSVGLVIYDSRVAAALTDLIERFCVASKRSAVPQALRFGLPPARGGHRRKPNRLHGHSYRTHGSADSVAWADDMLRASWLLHAVLHTGKARGMFANATSQRERFMLAQLGLFMLGYDLDDANDANDRRPAAPRMPVRRRVPVGAAPQSVPSGSALSVTTRFDEGGWKSAHTLGKGKKATTFTYTGSATGGATVRMGKGSLITINAATFRQALSFIRKAGGSVLGGFSKDNPTKGGLGEWLRSCGAGLSPPHASFLAAILVAEGLCSASHERTAVWLSVR